MSSYFIILISVSLLSACNPSFIYKTNPPAKSQLYSIEETLAQTLPKGSAWGKTIVNFNAEANDEVECKFASEAKFSAANYKIVNKVQNQYSLTLTEPDNSPNMGIYKIQCRGKSHGINVVSRAYDIFFHSKLANDERCDIASDSPSDKFFFEKAKTSLMDSGSYGTNTDVTKIPLQIEFTLPLKSRKFPAEHYECDPVNDSEWCFLLADGNHRAGAATDKYAGFPGNGFDNATSNFNFNWATTLRKQVHMDAAKKYLIIRKVWSYKGSCEFWLRKTVINPYESGPFAWQFSLGETKTFGKGVFGAYAVVINSRGQAVVLNKNGDVIHSYESIYSVLKKYLIHTRIYPESIDPEISHSIDDLIDPDGVFY